MARNYNIKPPVWEEVAMTQKFAKDSVWKTGQDMRVLGVAIPEGSRFTIPYPRRREDSKVAMKFLDIDVWYELHNTTIVPGRRKVVPKRTGRFTKADTLVPVTTLSHAELLSMPEKAYEYFIREIATGKVWTGGFFEPARFDKTDFGTASHYASEASAFRGMVILMTRSGLKPTTEPCWEVIEYDVSTNSIKRVIPTPSQWWSYAVWLSRALRKLRNDKSFSEDLKCLRAAMRKIPLDDVYRGNLILAHDVPRSYPRYEFGKLFSDLGVTTLVEVDKHTFFMSDEDRVMVKLMYPEVRVYTKESNA